MQIKQGGSWKAAYNGAKGVYGAQIVFQGSRDMYEISGAVFSQLTAKMSDSAAEELIRSRAAHLLARQRSVRPALHGHPGRRLRRLLPLGGQEQACRQDLGSRPDRRRGGTLRIRESQPPAEKEKERAEKREEKFQSVTGKLTEKGRRFVAPALAALQKCSIIPSFSLVRMRRRGWRRRWRGRQPRPA